MLINNLLNAALTSFAGCAVMAVLGSIALNHLKLSIITLDGEVHSKNTVAWFNNAKNAINNILFLIK